MKYIGVSVAAGVWLVLGGIGAVWAEDLTTLNGTTYLDITITKVEADGIRIQHKSGAAKVPASQLPAPFKQQHGLNQFAPTIDLSHEAPTTIATLDGKVYEKAVVKRVDADRIFILYAEGASTLDFTILPQDLQKKYGYDPVKALEAREKREAAERARVEALLAQKSHPATTHTPTAKPATPVAPAPAPASTPSAAATPTADSNKVTLLDLVQLAESIDLAMEEQRSRLGGTVNWRPAYETDYYYWYWHHKSSENAERRARQQVANGSRSTWTAAVAQAKLMLQRPVDIPPIKSWLNKFIKTSEYAGSNKRDDYHRYCKELIDDLDFLLKADAKP